MLIRLASVENAPGIARVMVDTWSSHRGQVPEEVWTKVRQKWTYEDEACKWAGILREIALGDLPGECVYVAVDEAGEIVGHARGGPSDEEGTQNTGEIWSLYVREGYQRCGIGRRLVQAVAAHLAEMGLNSLLIGCLAAGAPARRFYEALGGRVVGEREFDEDGVMLPLVVYGWPDTRALVATGRANPNDAKRRTPATSGC